MDLEVSLHKELSSFPLDVTFSVHSESFALLGASGSGKSMTLKCIAGLEHPDSGRVVLDGRVLFDSKEGIDLPPQERRIGYLFQSYALFPNKTVRENILFGAKGAREEKKRTLEKNLARFHLEKLASSYLATLSGGERQRVALARILAADVELLLLDEPFSALDGYLRFELSEEIQDVLAGFGGGILVTHDREEAYRMSDRIAVVNQGQIDQITTPEELFQRPKTLAAARLAGFQDISCIHVQDGRAFAEDWGMELTLSAGLGSARYIGIHAQQPVHTDGEGAGVLTGEISRRMEGPQSVTFLVRGTGKQPFYWEVRKEEAEDLAVGRRVSLAFPEDAVIWLEG